ncbi:LytR C-terminal domain-containing protein [Baekduia sp. Peel2402]|uniref:LytR C-terminal domain-containing protein n=1 Tax=Baekduia sp. Peel2402 TaxID=3458296 RepID=UPI00403E5D9E
MTSILALSVTDKIEQYGAYAGFASVLGLAVLSLLYFAQAREVKRLREWAGRSPERAAEQQERAVAAAQQRAVVQPQRPAAPTPGTPAAAAASQPRPAAATPAGQAASAPAGAAAAAATAAGAAGTATQTPPGAAGQPTTAMPAANGAAAASPPATPTPTPTPPARPGQPLRVPPNGPAGSTAARLQDPDDDEPRSRTGLFAAIGAIVVVLIVGGLLLSGVFSSDDTGTQPPSTVAADNSSNAADDGTSTTKKKTTTPSSAPKPGTYTVAVLNGTTVPGLARGVANRLQNTKYKIGNVTNAATQDRSATLVEFAQGHRAEADQVAKAIDVGSDSIQPLTAGSKTIAGDAATVVVTVGSDQNVSPQQTGTTG